MDTLTFNLDSVELWDGIAAAMNEEVTLEPAHVVVAGALFTDSFADEMAHDWSFAVTADNVVVTVNEPGTTRTFVATFETPELKTLVLTEVAS